MDVMNNYKVNRFLRKFGPHIAAVIILLLISFFDKPLAGILLIVYVAVAVLFSINW
jgi:hypothetical protein